MHPAQFVMWSLMLVGVSFVVGYCWPFNIGGLPDDWVRRMNAK